MVETTVQILPVKNCALCSHSEEVKVLTQSILQIHLLESRGGNETAARDGEPTHVGNFQADGNSGEVEQLTLLAASYLQWQGGFGVGTMENVLTKMISKNASYIHTDVNSCILHS